MSERYDTTFSLPSVDDDPDTEIGVLLMGFGPERLLAGLGVACRGEATDPATVTLLVDQLRHAVVPGDTFDTAVAEGARRWRDARAGLDAANHRPGTRSAALRRLWESAAAVIAASVDEMPRLRTQCAAERVYLTACWSRPEEITQIVEERCPT
jgi:hypothetical protein